MPPLQVRRRERLLAAVLLAVALVPPVLLARRIDRDRGHVTFLRWIDDQSGIERGDWADPLRSEAEAALYREILRAARPIAADFETQTVPAKWRILQHPELDRTYQSFLRLVDEGAVHLQGVEMDWTNSEVSANVGALLIGFRHAVADLMWLQVAAAWENGLINRMLPLTKTVVSLDPQFLEAYSLGAWHLAYNVAAMQATAVEKRGSIDDAIDLLENGLRKNPRSAQLYEELGYSVYFRKLEDLEQAEAYLVQGIVFDPHEPRMERAAALMIERQRREREAMALLRAFDVKHPTWTSHKHSMARLERKLEARHLEIQGRLTQALDEWRALDDGTLAEPVAPMEVVRLQGLVRAEREEAAGRLEEARAALMQARSRLPDAYHDSLNPEIRRLTARIEGPTGTG